MQQDATTHTTFHDSRHVQISFPSQWCSTAAVQQHFPVILASQHPLTQLYCPRLSVNNSHRKHTTMNPRRSTDKQTLPVLIQNCRQHAQMAYTVCWQPSGCSQNHPAVLLHQPRPLTHTIQVGDKRLDLLISRPVTKACSTASTTRSSNNCC